MTRILIVDDEPINHQLVARALESLNAQLEYANNGNEGIARARTLKPDAIITDVMMPNMNGLQVLEKLFHQEAKCSIVLMSGHGERLEAAEKLAKQLDLRLIGTLEKPFRLRDILDVLEGT